MSRISYLEAILKTHQTRGSFSARSPHTLNSPGLTGGIDGSYNLDVQVLSLLCWGSEGVNLQNSKYGFGVCFLVICYHLFPYFTLKSMSRLIFPISLLIVV